MNRKRPFINSRSIGAGRGTASNSRTAKGRVASENNTAETAASSEALPVDTAIEDDSQSPTTVVL